MSAQFIDISNWSKDIGIKPQKGSRPNNIYENPETGIKYFFKQSKPNFPSEFWSEIISSKIGQYLGFKVLDYNIAIDKKDENDIIAGCISKSMVNKDHGEELYHGVDILKDYIDGFVISNKPICSFQDWVKLCHKDGTFHNFIIHFIDIILFDAIIGNTDRHTENWAFIKKNISLEYEFSGKYKAVLKKFFSKKKLSFKLNDYTFAPIYDSGSCLGREKDENVINEFLSNSVNIEKYILNGRSEIKWENKSLNLFDIAKEVYYLYNDLVESKVLKFKNNELLTNIHNIIDNVDINVPKEFENFKLSLQRKKMIYKIIEYRINYLNKILVK